MYINNEKDLEDYICNNLDDFISFLREIYGEDEEIEFVGRQIIIGDSRLDLLFQIQGQSDVAANNMAKTYIVIELKFRKAEPKDIAQLSRYMNLLHNLEFDERIGGCEVFVKGILLTTGLEHEMQEIQMYLNDYSDTDITFAHIETSINYEVDSFSRKEEYIEKISVDSRLRETKEEKRCGKKENG